MIPVARIEQDILALAVLWGAKRKEMKLVEDELQRLVEERDVEVSHGERRTD